MFPTKIMEVSTWDWKYGRDKFFAWPFHFLQWKNEGHNRWLCGGSGDLFIDGKVIPRPEYRYSERQTTRNRPRPRYDRRRETMQVDRREPTHLQNLSQGQGRPMQRSSPMNSQNSASGGGTGNQANVDNNSWVGNAWEISINVKQFAFDYLAAWWRSNYMCLAEWRSSTKRES